MKFKFQHCVCKLPNIIGYVVLFSPYYDGIWELECDHVIWVRVSKNRFKAKEQLFRKGVSVSLSGSLLTFFKYIMYLSEAFLAMRSCVIPCPKKKNGSGHV